MVVHDRLFTEKVKVHLNALFDPNNNAVKDLKNLLPRRNHFKNGAHHFKRTGFLKSQTGLPFLNLGGLLPEINDFKDLKRQKFLLIQRAGVGFPLGTWLTVLI